MPSPSPPNSQKAADAPIAFALTAPGESAIFLSLSIRPEDLTYTEPSLQTVSPTLGGAFVDDFGRGIASIQLSGHTGWRRDADGDDGPERLLKLRDTVWKQWHAKRETAVAAGNNPNDVVLSFVDTLNDITVNVAPGQFVLRRSRSRPLLSTYQIGMTVLGDASDATVTAAASAAAGSGALSAGQASLSRSIATISGLSGGLSALLSGGPLGAIAHSLASFNALAVGALNLASGAAAVIGSGVNAGATAAITFAADIAGVGRQLYRSLGAVTGLPGVVTHAVGLVAAAFENAMCVLRNAIRPPYLSYDDLAELFGSSLCSSTAGGRPISPWADINPFERLAPLQSPPPTVSAAARAAMVAIASSDPIAAPIPPSAAGGLADVVVAGITGLGRT